MKSLKFQVPSSKFKATLFTYFCFAFCFLYLSSITDAAYKIYLKNGSEIRGISHYEKTEGEIRFYFEGGMIGVPEADVLKIEGSEEPAEEVKEPKAIPEEKPTPQVPDTRFEWLQKERPETPPVPPREPADKNKLISQKYEELKNVEEELNITKVRIQNLYSKSVKGTISAEERSMLQQNMVKKRKLEEDKQRLEEELKKLR